NFWCQRHWLSNKIPVPDLPRPGSPQTFPGATVRPFGKPVPSDCLSSALVPPGSGCPSSAVAPLGPYCPVFAVPPRGVVLFAIVLSFPGNPFLFESGPAPFLSWPPLVPFPPGPEPGLVPFRGRPPFFRDPFCQIDRRPGSRCWGFSLPG